MSDNDRLKFEFTEKLKLLKDIRHEIKRKRFLLDESVDKFGFDDLSLLSKVPNVDEVKGYPMVASKNQSKILKGLKVGVKVVPMETKFEKHEHPTNLEFISLKELTDNVILKNISPHFVYYLGNQKVSNKSRALKFLNLKRLEVEDQIRSSSNMLLSEYIEGGSLDNWVYDVYENDIEITNEEWKTLVFQLIYSIAIMQHYYKMMHNDFHYGNILIDNSIKKVKGQYFVYKIQDDVYYLPSTGFIPKCWDFEFAMCYSNKLEDFYPNKFIIGNNDYDRKTCITKDTVKKPDEESFDSDDLNVPYNYNETYDLHYFLTSLLDLYVSQELFDWIVDIYPDELIPREDSSSTDSSSSVSKSKPRETSGEFSQDDILKTKMDKIKLSEASNKSLSSASTDTSTDASTDASTDDSSDCSTDASSDASSDGSSSSEYNRYLSEGRMKNGIESQFEDLPTPAKILKHSFFDSFKQKPSDFDESKALYFNAGF
jgi:hypothetical protein